VLEYNVRFGDPEAQVILELLDEDLPALLMDVALGRLDRKELKVHSGVVLAVVLAESGYPGPVTKGLPIQLGNSGVTVIHAGTKQVDGQWVTNSGRVLNLVTRDLDLDTARGRIAAGLAQICWPGMQFRSDIGARQDVRLSGDTPRRVR
jgi:phosphoribosylamine-glycine ligase